jgi:hypothetical protein
MYLPIENGTSVNIQGLTCHLPPEGYVFNIITKRLEWRGVYERSPHPNEQYWERPALPAWYKDVMKAWDDFDARKKDDDESEFYDERLEAFKGQEWDRRLNGFWYRNNGKATYLTGLHYFYLMWWQIDIGAPKFRMPDLEKAYFIQYCIEDPLCMGMVEVTKRRFGKSFWAGAFITEYITRTKMANGGIQSKTGPDAKKFFGKTVVNPFRRLPKFFRPEYDMSLGVNPKSELRFQKTNIRGKKANSAIDRDELGSLIDWGSADKVHYDGQKLQVYIADECGKTTEVDVYERHEVIRYCLLDDEGKVIGKALYTTTVEKLDSDKDGVQDAFKLLWDESNQLARRENGMTGSGLYRFFMSAKRTRNFDAYGFPDEEKTEAAILADREGVKNNPRALFARTRKEPLTIEEAFSIDADTCIFNAPNIAKRERELVDTPVYKRKVWFYRDIDQKVKWRDPTNAEKEFCWEMTWLPEEKEANKCHMDGSIRKPVNGHLGAIGIDGYANSQGGQKWGSRASAWIGWRHNADNPNQSYKPFGHLYGRPQEKDTLHEQVMLAAEYYSYPVGWEHVADDYDSYFKVRGRRAYLSLYPKITIDPEKRETAERHRGVPTTPFSLNKQTDLGVTYFNNHCHRIDWQELLDDAKTFDPNDRTKFDRTVSFLIWLVMVNEPIPVAPPRKAPLVKTYPAPQRT